MTVLRLHTGSLRAALAAGVVPTAVARRPVAAASDGVHAWVRPDDDLRARLARLGTPVVADDLLLGEVPCWAVLVPVEPDPRAVGGPCLSSRTADGRGELRIADGRAWRVSAKSGEYTERAAGVWVRVGWRHPLPELLAPPHGGELAVGPGGEWFTLPSRGYRAVAELPVPRFDCTGGHTPVVRLPVRLARRKTPPPSVWVRPTDRATAAADLLAVGGPDLLATATAATFGSPVATVVRIDPPADVPGWADGLSELPGRPGWFAPFGWAPEPCPPPDTLGPSLWSADRRRLVLPTPFTPLASVVRYTSADRRRLALRAWVCSLDPSPAAPPDGPTTEPPAARLPDRPTPRPAATPRRSKPVHKSAADSTAEFKHPTGAEVRLLEHLPTSTAGGQVRLWRALAEQFERNGRHVDASVCWLNCCWLEPSAETFQRWRAAEVAADRPGRLAAAALATDPETPLTLRAALERLEAEVPTRGVWLAWRAVADRTGDRLALARCADRLARRTGPALDLDVPGFLRRGDPAADLGDAREWLRSAGGRVRGWVMGCVGDTRLTKFGLDGDRVATGQYAELILAWGRAAAGDRVAVADALASGALLTRRATDPTVHQALVAAFSERVRAAADGRPADLPTPRATGLAGFAIRRLTDGCECLGGSGAGPFDTPADRLIRTAHRARIAHRPGDLRAALTGLDAGGTVYAAAAAFRACRSLGMHTDAVRLIGTVAALRPPAGGRRDLGLAVGRYHVGDRAGGDAALDAGRRRLLIDGVADPRERGELAAAYATAVGHAGSGAVGRLDELFRRLGPVSPAGACGRYFALLPLRVVDAAVRAAVGDDFAPSPAVLRVLADEELTTRRRIARDIKQLLSAEC